MAEQLVLDVEGDCGACEQRIDTTLGALAGVRSVRADHRTGQVRVLFDPAQVEKALLAGRVTAAGFTVTGPVEANQ